jgi:hypothetical protein
MAVPPGIAYVEDVRVREEDRNIGIRVSRAVVFERERDSVELKLAVFRENLRWESAFWLTVERHWVGLLCHVAAETAVHTCDEPCSLGQFLILSPLRHPPPRTRVLRRCRCPFPGQDVNPGPRSFFTTGETKLKTRDHWDARPDRA